MINWWMPRLVAAKEASLAVIPPASALAQFITHRVRCHFTLPGNVSMENLIMPPTTMQAALPTVQRANSSARARGHEEQGIISCSCTDLNRSHVLLALPTFWKTDGPEPNWDCLLAPYPQPDFKDCLSQMENEVGVKAGTIENIWMQQVNLMGITIKSLAEIEEEVSRGCNARLTLTPLAQNAKQRHGILVSELPGSDRPLFTTTSAQREALLCNYPPRSHKLTDPKGKKHC
ncbi:hypothetical protein PAMP_022302 [Pampus punctatissimus]